VVDTFWANLGSALHHITEKGADDKHLVEERLFVDVEDWTISGAIDVQRLEDDNSITIMDYKFTSVWAAVRCEDNYCKVNQWCPQYQQVLKG
jgi:RecB family exonuclease